ncbi:PREDICTED: serine/arginine repetitive matrix protein 3-like [Chrysochloris asiatica]|uniref:Serine/arginine repetitive matrix protein 3-like n=1 Tax=Chrysochloris asiatica TaxID=185453 RepID=A0A9B0TR84_CHRAS|nr:PREDICTED: serine/arginine repetitive matrix protein 3-like [Chrysochloris asiatica]
MGGWRGPAAALGRADYLTCRCGEFISLCLRNGVCCGTHCLGKKPGSLQPGSRAAAAEARPEPAAAPPTPRPEPNSPSRRQELQRGSGVAPTPSSATAVFRGGKPRGQKRGEAMGRHCNERAWSRQQEKDATSSRNATCNPRQPLTRSLPSPPRPLSK